MTDAEKPIKPNTGAYVLHDDVGGRLDEMADLCEHWKRWRTAKNHTPNAIRTALVMLAHEIAILDEREKTHGMRREQL